MLKLTFLGDILCDTSLNIDKYKEGTNYNFDSIFTDLRSVLKESDYVFANLETPISHDDTNLTNARFEFNSPLEFAKAVKNMGVNYVSTANNHCLDRDIKGLISTIESLDEIKLEHSGTYCPNTKRDLTIIHLNNLSIGVLAYTYGTNAYFNHRYLGYKNRLAVDLIQEQEGTMEKYKLIKRLLSRWPNSIFYRAYNKFDRKINSYNVNKEPYEKITFNKYRMHLLKKDIKRIKKKCDLSVFYLHIGGQYNKEPSEYTKKMVNYLLNKGINIIIANHEHVIHGSINSIKNNQFATYAIGNLLGGNGTTFRPFDMYAEYSIVVHVYVDDISKKINDITFSVTKSVLLEEGKYKVVFLAPYLETLESKEKDKLTDEVLEVAYRFSGRKYDKIYHEFKLI